MLKNKDIGIKLSNDISLEFESMVDLANGKYYIFRDDFTIYHHTVNDSPMSFRHGFLHLYKEIEDIGFFDSE